MQLIALLQCSLSLLLLPIIRSLTAAAPMRAALLRCSNQCLRILLRALSRFDTTRLVSALASAPRRLTHGSLTVDQYVCLARLQFSIVPQRQSKSNVCRVCVDTLRRSRRRRRRLSRRCCCVCVCVSLDVASFLQLARKCPTAAQQLYTQIFVCRRNNNNNNLQITATKQLHLLLYLLLLLLLFAVALARTVFTFFRELRLYCMRVRVCACVCMSICVCVCIWCVRKNVK